MLRLRACALCFACVAGVLLGSLAPAARADGPAESTLRTARWAKLTGATSALGGSRPADWSPRATPPPPAQPEPVRTETQVADWSPRALASPSPQPTDRTDDGHTWLDLPRQWHKDRRLALADKPAAKHPAADADGKMPWEVPYKLRRGPAYPDDVWRTFKTDMRELPGGVWDDSKVFFKDPRAWVMLGLAGVSGILVNGSKLDREVEEHYEVHYSDMNTEWDMVGDVGGNPGTHFALAGAMYFYGAYTGDKKTYEVSKTLLNALSINGLLTVGLKLAVQTRSPNGDAMGWPSGHTSSTFCLATVLHKAYGPWVGVPAFAFAGFVGYERIQARNHDVSDVISGALIGIAVGYIVAEHHEQKIFGMTMEPYVDTERGGFGLAFVKRW